MTSSTVDDVIVFVRSFDARFLHNDDKRNESDGGCRDTGIMYNPQVDETATATLVGSLHTRDGGALTPTCQCHVTPATWILLYLHAIAD